MQNRGFQVSVVCFTGIMMIKHRSTQIGWHIPVCQQDVTNLGMVNVDQLALDLTYIPVRGGSDRLGFTDLVG